MRIVIFPKGTVKEDSAPYRPGEQVLTTIPRRSSKGSEFGLCLEEEDTVLFSASLELEFCHPAGRVAISHRTKLDQ